MTEKRTEIAQIGEFGLIRHLQKNIKIQQPSSLAGIGDDAAVLDTHPDKKLLVSTDMLLEGIHFDLSYMPLTHLGYKAVAVNVSDIAAMNGIPLQITIGLGLSNRFSLEAVEALYEGIQLACEAYKVDLVGGDTCSSRSGLVLSITVMGVCEPEKITYRHTAKKGDILCVTGDLGAAYVGLQILEREKQVFMTAPQAQPDLERHEYVVRRQLKPDARMDIIHELRELNVIPTAMIDISDGLASEVMHLCSNSNVGALLYETHIPIDMQAYQTAAELNLSPLTCALNGGEDYELLFTIKQEDYEKVKKHPDIHFIGYMHEAEKGIKIALKSEQFVELKAQGWNHFE